MTENLFNTTASKIIEQLAYSIEEQDIEGLIEVDFNGDVISLSTAKGIFVINKHNAAKEIWLASPISGPHHFKPTINGWFDREGEELFKVLENELNQLPNINLKLL